MKLFPRLRHQREVVPMPEIMEDQRRCMFLGAAPQEYHGKLGIFFKGEDFDPKDPHSFSFLPDEYWRKVVHCSENDVSVREPLPDDPDLIDLGLDHWALLTSHNKERFPLAPPYTGMLEYHYRLGADGRTEVLCAVPVDFWHPDENYKGPIWKLKKLEPLDIVPSVFCKEDLGGCGSHGNISDGNWSNCSWRRHWWQKRNG